MLKKSTKSKLNAKSPRQKLDDDATITPFKLMTIMAEFAKTALKRAFWKAKGKKISLTGITELPDEVVLQIAEYVLHDYSTSGYIARPATVEHHKPPEADKPYRRQSSRRTGNTLLTACALCTLLEKATEALWETLKSPRRAFRLMFPKKVLPNLSFLVVNRRLNRVGRDVLFRLNTFTLTSTETKLLLERPGTERLFRDLNVYGELHELGTSMRETNITQNEIPPNPSS